MSEMSFEKRIKSADEICKAGDVIIKVRVMSVDLGDRASLSIKRVGDDPWTGTVRWAEDSIVTGMVKRIAEFGEFVELVPGVEGLVHISEIATEHVRTVGEALREGQVVQAKVLEVDEDRKLIGLSIKQLITAADYTGAAPTEETPAEPAKPAKKRKAPLKGGLD